MTFCVAACRGVMTSLMVSKSTWFTARSACSTCMTGSPSRFVASPWMRCGCDRSMLMICSVSGVDAQQRASLALAAVGLAAVLAQQVTAEHAVDHIGDRHAGQSRAPPQFGA